MVVGHVLFANAHFLGELVEGALFDLVIFESLGSMCKDEHAQGDVRGAWGYQPGVYVPLKAIFLENEEIVAFLLRLSIIYPCSVLVGRRPQCQRTSPLKPLA